MARALLRGLGLACASAQQVCRAQPQPLMHTANTLQRHHRRALASCPAAQSAQVLEYPKVSLYNEEVELYAEIFGDREFDKEVPRACSCCCSWRCSLPLHVWTKTAWMRLFD